MRVTWVKGHATQEMVDKGEARLRDKRGNDEADGLANRGTQDECGIVALGRHYARREKRHVEFAQKVCSTIIAVMTPVGLKLQDEAKHRKLQQGLGLLPRTYIPSTLPATRVGSTQAPPEGLRPRLRNQETYHQRHATLCLEADGKWEQD